MNGADVAPISCRAVTENVFSSRDQTGKNVSREILRFSVFDEVENLSGKDVYAGVDRPGICPLPTGFFDKIRDPSVFVCQAYTVFKRSFDLAQNDRCRSSVPFVKGYRRTEVCICYCIAADNKKISVDKTFARFNAACRSERLVFFDEDYIPVGAGVAYLCASVTHGRDHLGHSVFFQKIESVKNAGFARYRSKRFRNFCRHGHESRTHAARKNDCFQNAFPQKKFYREYFKSATRLYSKKMYDT